jgi:hypothetical protein
MMRVVSLWRYFMWCEMQRNDSKAVKVTWETDFFDSIEMQRWFMHLSYWYCGLYVVCEGWQELKLTDSDIDHLLSSPYLDVLRRYRNGVFHYQHDYFDVRIKEAIEAGEPFRLWVEELMQHFSRFFTDWFNKHRSLIRSLKLQQQVKAQTVN